MQRGILFFAVRIVRSWLRWVNWCESDSVVANVVNRVIKSQKDVTEHPKRVSNVISKVKYSEVGEAEGRSS